MNEVELEKYERLVNIIVNRLSINKDQTRERLELLRSKQLFDLNDLVHNLSLIRFNAFLSTGNAQLLEK